MTTITAKSAPREVDEALAALWHLADKARATWNAAGSIAHSQIGERAHYVSRTVREWPTTDAVALEILAAGIAAVEAHYAATGTYSGTPGPVASYNLSGAQRTLAKRAESRATLDDLEAKIADLEEIYAARRWSRFFLVTSSTGHVHASMHCQTCRWSTTFGWLPDLSGKTEADAVAELGTVLCSVCFPSAPVAHVGGKITKAQAAKLAA